MTILHIIRNILTIAALMALIALAFDKDKRIERWSERHENLGLAAWLMLFAGLTCFPFMMSDITRNIEPLYWIWLVARCLLAIWFIAIGIAARIIGSRARAWFDNHRIFRGLTGATAVIGFGIVLQIAASA